MIRHLHILSPFCSQFFVVYNFCFSWIFFILLLIWFGLVSFIVVVAFYFCFSWISFILLLIWFGFFYCFVLYYMGMMTQVQGMTFG